MNLDEKPTEEPPSNEIELKDVENNTEKKLPYPKSVFFIISNEFCERFSYYGMRTVLSLYLTGILKFSENDSTVIYHLWNSLCYFFPIIGALISDSWLGKYNTILYVSILYAIGNILLALASTSPLNIPQAPFSLLALFLIALGTGGIKPCVSSFGGDQFVLPQQAVQLAAFFSVFYFSINAGSLISTFMTPVLREDVKCFGEDSCYPLAFAIPGALMIVSIVVFVLGSKLYKVNKPQGNIMVRVCKCIAYAIKQKKNKEDHWLDRATPKYGQKLVNEVKITLKVLVIFTPLPIFWSLYDQQGTRWTFQATRMSGDIGFYTILPDQMQVVNPILILAFIPIFTYWVYPFFAKFNMLTNPLTRMITGGLLAAAAFAISAGVSFAIEATNPTLPSDGAYQLRLYNPTSCNINGLVLTPGNDHIPNEIEAMNSTILILNSLDEKGFVSYQFDSNNCTQTGFSGRFNFTEAKGVFYSFGTKGLIGGEDNIDKPDDGLPVVRTLISRSSPIEVVYRNRDGGKVLSIQSDNSSLLAFKPGKYFLQNATDGVDFKLGGVYTVLAQLGTDNVVTNVKNVVVTKPSSVHILWQLPQNFVITAAEIFISITGLEFSYAMAPVSMKSVMSAMFLLTSAFGNILIVIIESIKIFDKQSYDFLLYTGLMLVDMLIFGFLALRFDPPELIEDEDEGIKEAKD